MKALSEPIQILHSSNNLGYVNKPPHILFILVVTMLAVACSRNLSTTPQSTSTSSTLKADNISFPTLTYDVTASATASSLETGFTFDMRRIEIPWLGPATDIPGTVLPVYVGDADGDGDNELLVTMHALDGVPQPDLRIQEGNRVREGLVKILAWTGENYELVSYSDVDSRWYLYPLSRVENISVVEWNNRPYVALGASAWRTNVYGALRIIDVTGPDNSLLYNTICLGDIYRLDPIEVNDEMILFVSALFTPKMASSVTGLQECPLYDPAEPEAEAISLLGIVRKNEEGFTTHTYQQDLSYPLLLARLPDTEGSLYYLTTDWSLTPVTVTTHIWQENEFVPTESLIEYTDVYVLSIKAGDLDGDGLLELIILHGSHDEYRLAQRDLYGSVEDMHLDIYKWEENAYRLVWRHTLVEREWDFAVGDFDNNGTDEIITYRGLIINWQQGHYVTSRNLIEQLNEWMPYFELKEWLPGEVLFLIGDSDNDHKNEVLMLMRVDINDLPSRIATRIWEERGEMPPEGIYYLYVIESVQE